MNHTTERRGEPVSRAVCDSLEGGRIALRVFGLYCLVCLLVAGVTPAAQVDGRLWFAALTPHFDASHHCPLCGMTRAFVCLAHGEATRAECLNGLSLPVFVLFVVVAATAVADVCSRFARCSAAAAWRGSAP